MQSDGHKIENNLYWQGLGGHEPKSLQRFTELARNTGVVLDVGANTGIYALAAAASNPNVQVHAFEPVPRIAAMLQENVDLNPDCHIRVHRAAVGGHTGRVPIYDPGGENAYSASLDPTFLGGHQASYFVRQITVDDFVKEQELSSVGLVKIDAEGWEPQVLQGMASTLRAHKPWVLMESLPSLRHAWQPEVEKVKRLGYEVAEVIEGENNVLLAPPAQ